MKAVFEPSKQATVSAVYPPSYTVPLHEITESGQSPVTSVINTGLRCPLMGRANAPCCQLQGEFSFGPLTVKMYV